MGAAAIAVFMLLALSSLVPAIEILVRNGTGAGSYSLLWRSSAPRSRAPLRPDIQSGIPGCRKWVIAWTLTRGRPIGSSRRAAGTPGPPGSCPRRGRDSRPVIRRSSASPSSVSRHRRSPPSRLLPKRSKIRKRRRAARSASASGRRAGPRSWPSKRKQRTSPTSNGTAPRSTREAPGGRGSGSVFTVPGPRVMIFFSGSEAGTRSPSPSLNGHRACPTSPAGYGPNRPRRSCRPSLDDGPEDLGSLARPAARVNRRTGKAPDLRLIRPAAVFADLEGLGKTELGSAVLAVPVPRGSSGTGRRWPCSGPRTLS